MMLITLALGRALLFPLAVVLIGAFVCWLIFLWAKDTDLNKKLSGESEKETTEEFIERVNETAEEAQHRRAVAEAAAAKLEADAEKLRSTFPDKD